MSYADHEQYVIPCPYPAVVTHATHKAQQLLAQSQGLLRQAHSIPEDPRLQRRVHQLLMDVFKIEPGWRSPSQVFEVQERFNYLAQAAPKARVFCVSDKHPMNGDAGKLGHSAFAEIGTHSAPMVYLCPAFFLSSTHQASTIVHELAHGRLGVGHRGGEFLSFGCTGSPLKSYEDAIENAYSYDLFAECATHGD